MPAKTDIELITDLNLRLGQLEADLARAQTVAQFAEGQVQAARNHIARQDDKIERQAEEIAALKMALRDEYIHPVKWSRDRGVERLRCSGCLEAWDFGQAEIHAPDCRARLDAAPAEVKGACDFNSMCPTWPDCGHVVSRSRM